MPTPLEGVAVTQLKGFFDAVAVCTDSVGDLYIADDSRQVIFEYAPGGSLPINVFDDAGQEPVSCAVSPLSGNLAVANGSNVVVYPASQSAMPVAFTTPEIASYACVGYDASGNLYVNGYGADKSFQLATLRAGGSSLATTRVASLNNRKHGAGGLAWDGEYLVLADPITYELYRIALQGSSGTVAHAARIRGWHDRFAVQFALWGKKLLFPLNNKLLIFAYPPRRTCQGRLLRPPQPRHRPLRIVVVLLLGIETSCDDTATAVVRDGREVLSSVSTNQDEFHSKIRGHRAGNREPATRRAALGRGGRFARRGPASTLLNRSMESR